MNDRNIRIKNTRTPVLLLGCKLGALAIMRSLGSQGVKVYGVDDDPQYPALRSRYLYRKYFKVYQAGASDRYLRFLIDVGKSMPAAAILIPTSDELSEFVAENRASLKPYFLFPDNSIDLVRGLASKKEMFGIASQVGVPTPQTLFPRNLADVIAYAKRIEFPVMLKGIYGNRLQEKTGLKMVIVPTYEELLKYYQLLEDPVEPNLMLQEYIPGGDDQIYIFNGYFNSDSECLIGYTGYKVRQFPIHVGCASMGECRWNEDVARITIDFMKRVGYRGILDIGYRFDPRDGRYKVLDVNPRVGQAFRIFVAQNGLDVVRALYLDMTGQNVPSTPSREGRRWIIEDYDVISSLHYHNEGNLSLYNWIKSFKKLEEAAWFNRNDPMPFVIVLRRFILRGLKWILKTCAHSVNPQPNHPKNAGTCKQ
ncbi:MAG: hypothetical protein C4519_04470 [Desulfobacteraceae bacterium]|nr:MAG: hypothetical protein C4519_04470 [Desulfobacteraceae bacterium]